MPAPLFAIGTAIVKGAKAISKSPIFQNALAAATIAGGNSAQGRNTTLISSGSTHTIAPDTQIIGANNNTLLIVGAAIVALFLIFKK
jgi:hypothetical protein